MKIIQELIEESLTDVIEVRSADYSGHYTINISFSDGTKRSLDFEPFLNKSHHPSISKYLDESLFGKFEIHNGNLNWNSYDMIFPVSDLYLGTIL